MAWIPLPLFLSRLVTPHIHIQVSTRFGNVPCKSTSMCIKVQLLTFVISPEGKPGHHLILLRRLSTPRNCLELISAGIRARGIQYSDSAVRQLIQPLNWQRQVPFELHSVCLFDNLCRLFSKFPTFNITNRKGKSLNPVIIFLTWNLLRPIRHNRSSRMHDRVINLLSPNHRLIQVNVVSRFLTPTSQIRVIVLKTFYVIGNHFFVGIKFEDIVQIAFIIPTPDRTRLACPCFTLTERRSRNLGVGALANLCNHEVNSSFRHLVSMQSVRIGIRRSLLTRREREEGQNENGSQRHHSQNGDEGDTLFIPVYEILKA